MQAGPISPIVWNGMPRMAENLHFVVNEKSSWDTSIVDRYQY